MRHTNREVLERVLAFGDVVAVEALRLEHAHSTIEPLQERRMHRAVERSLNGIE